MRKPKCQAPSFQFGRRGPFPSFLEWDMGRFEPKTQVKWYIREWREHLDLSQEQVAHRLNTNKGQISKLETGKQRMNDDWLAALAHAYNLHPSRLLLPPDTTSVDDLLIEATPDDVKAVRQTLTMMLRKSGR